VRIDVASFKPALLVLNQPNAVGYAKLPNASNFASLSID